MKTAGLLMALIAMAAVLVQSVEETAEETFVLVKKIRALGKALYQRGDFAGATETFQGAVDQSMATLLIPWRCLTDSVRLLFVDDWSPQLP